jgi:hypothetical protein
MWGFIDLSGAVTVNPIFDEVGEFSDGLAPANYNGKWGYIDKRGAWQIDPSYENAHSFVNGLASVELGEQTVFIDKSGQIVFGIQNDLFEK